MSSRRRKSWRMSATAAQLSTIAANVFEGHGGFIQRGADLMPSSALWRRKDGSMTARFVYRYPDDADGGKYSVVVTVRNIRAARA